MSWQPKEDQKKLMETLVVMTVDCLMGKGTSNEETYTGNLRTIARLIDEKGELNGKSFNIR